MHFIKNILYVVCYVALISFVGWYFYTLISNKKKTSRPFGRKKAILNAINSHPNIASYSDEQLESVLRGIEEHFYLNGEVNYEELLDALTRVKNHQLGINDTNVQVIDKLTEFIRDSRPFLHVSIDTGVIFQRLNDDLNNNNYSLAIDDLKLLYLKTAGVEAMLKKRGKREFWVGIIIGLIGVAISIISMFF